MGPAPAPVAKRYLYRAFLALLLLFFVFQMAVSRFWGEPYPGLFQPSFGGKVDAAGTAVVEEPTVTVTYTDGSVRTFSHRDVMAESKSLQLAVFRSAFAPDSPRRSDPQTVAWLGQRLSDLGDGRRPEHAVLLWRDVTYDLADQRPPQTSVTDRTYISFGDHRG